MAAPIEVTDPFVQQGSRTWIVGLAAPLGACVGSPSDTLNSWGWLVALAVLAGLSIWAYWLGSWVQRRSAQAELFDVRRRQAALLGNLSGAVWQTDAQHRPLSGAALLHSGSALIEVDDAWLQSPEMQQQLQSLRGFVDLRLPSAVVSGAAAADGVQQVHSHWLVSGQPLTDQQGLFAGFVGTARAAPPSAAMAAADVAVSEFLVAPALGHQATASESDSAQQFSINLAHDLRAPIRVVDGFTRIIKEDYGPGLDRVANDHLDRVLNASARMNQMVDALLALAKLSQLSLQLQAVDLSRMAEEVLDELRRTQPERELELHVEPGMVVRADPTLLRMVMDNLLGNAWKYSARTPKSRISVSSQTHGNSRAFVVRDNGAGFDMRAAERLFGVFQRLHSASEFPGHGVGLASVKRIVERHGGQIWAEAEPARGATFSFTLGELAPQDPGLSS